MARPKKKPTIDDAIAEVKHQYDLARYTEFVRNPIAYALYQTWKKYDKEQTDGKEEKA